MTEIEQSPEGKREEILNRCPFTRGFLDGASNDETLFDAVSDEFNHYFGIEVFKLMKIGFKEDIEATDLIPDDFSEKESIIESLLVIGYEIGDRNDTRIFAREIVDCFARMGAMDEDLLYTADFQKSASEFVLRLLNSGVSYREEIMKMKSTKEAGDEKKRLKPFDNWYRNRPVG